jgi:hypothetical protein
MTCGAHIVSNDVTELSTRSLSSTQQPRITPLAAADVLKFDVFQYNANLREAFADTPEVLVHCPVSYHTTYTSSITHYYNILHSIA